MVRVTPDGSAAARIETESGAPVEALARVIRYMLRLDDDLSAFYERAADDPDLAWAADGAGRMVRSPTVFEDLVKTICTTNCTWSATQRMVGALVNELGTPATPDRRTFPTAATMAEAGDDFYTGVAKAGYRGPTSRRSPPTSPKAGSTSRRSTIPRNPTKRWPSACSRSPASARTRART